MRQRTLAVALGLAASACPAPTHEVKRVSVSAQMTTDRLRGGELMISHAIEGWALETDLAAKQLVRDELDGLITRREIGVSLGVGLRLSLLGIVAKNDHRLEHWFDIGGAGGVTAGLVYPARLAPFGEAWVGGWVAFGLYPGELHPSLVLDVRRVAVYDWNDATVFTVGFAFTRRFLGNGFSVHD